MSDLLPLEAMTESAHLARNDPLNNIRLYSQAESPSYRNELRAETSVNSADTLNGMASSKSPGTNSSAFGLSLGSPTARRMRRSTPYTTSQRYHSDSKPYANTGNKRQRIDFNTMKSLSPREPESPDLDIDYNHNYIICDNPQCGILICSKSECEGNDIIICDQGDKCNISTACNEDCLGSENTGLFPPRGQWSLRDLRGLDDQDSSQVFANALAPHLSTSTSSSSTVPFLSNNSSSTYSSQADLRTSKGQFPPQNSYQDSSDISFHNVESYFLPPDGSSTDNGLESTWNNPGQLSDNQENPFSFQCPWLDCSLIIENGEQWNQHFHQEHIDPQMIYSCPFKSESCPVTMSANPMAHLETHHGYDFSLNEVGYRCPSESCRQGMKYFNQTSFHDHLDHFHANPSSGQLQCRLWACGNWFDDSSKLISHAMQNHTIPVWNTTVDTMSSPTEPVPPKPQLESQPQNAQNSLDNMSDEALQATKEIFNHQLSLKLQEKGIQYSATCPASKKKNWPEVEKHSLHKCLWKDLEGIICGISFDSENDLQNHIKESHLEILDNKTGYYCCWDKCTREIRLGAKAGFSQRGKLERHMTTHSNCKLIQLEIYCPNFL